MKKFLLIQIIIILLCSCHVDSYKKYYSNGQIKEEYSILNGKISGDFKAFYSDGTLKAKGKYYRGNFDGFWQYYYPNGKIQSIQKLNNGKLLLINWWSIKGNQEIKDGTGSANLYYPNGKMLSKMSYKDNALHGKCETWFTNGLKETELYYDKGKLVRGCFWNMNGKLIKNENYSN